MHESFTITLVTHKLFISYITLEAQFPFQKIQCRYFREINYPTWKLYLFYEYCIRVLFFKYPNAIKNSYYSISGSWNIEATIFWIYNRYVIPFYYAFCPAQYITWRSRKVTIEAPWCVWKGGYICWYNRKLIWNRRSTYIQHISRRVTYRECHLGWAGCIELLCFGVIHPPMRT